MNIASVLALWYKKNKRDLPWRQTKDPYIIWLSEIMLQQTRVEQGLPFFEKFAEEFPTVKSFASADEDKILKMWQGLGYYSRARNMHFTAKEIVNKYSGKFPDEFSELKKLKGIGEYTAAAISSFAFNKPHAVVDGNVYRFLARYFGIKNPVDSSTGKKIFLKLANQLLDRKNPGLYNQAIMEFGALQCKPANPDCNVCPFCIDCFALKKNKTNQFPVKSKTRKITERYFHYLFIRWRSKIFLQKRTENDIWKNLYEFPLIETKTKKSAAYLVKTKEWKSIFGAVGLHLRDASMSSKHKLSHQTIYVTFYEIDFKKNLPKNFKKQFLEIDKGNLRNYGVPVLIDKFLKQKI